MNGVNELTNEIIGAAIEVHRTLSQWASGASSMSFQNNLCDLRVLSGEYVTGTSGTFGSPRSRKTPVANCYFLGALAPQYYHPAPVADRSAAGRTGPMPNGGPARA